MVVLTKHGKGGSRRKCSAAVGRRFIFEQRREIPDSIYFGVSVPPSFYFRSERWR